MTGARVILDANVLFDSYLRDLLLELAVAGIFEPLWTAEILGELHRALGLRYPSSASQHGHLIEAFDLIFPNSKVAPGPPPETSLGCSDPGDEHVLWAALATGATHLVTHNISDFPVASSAEGGLIIIGPDGFLMALTARQPNRVRHATLRILRQYSRPPVSTAELCAAMQRSRCPDFAQWLAGSAQSIG